MRWGSSSSSAHSAQLCCREQVNEEVQEARHGTAHRTAHITAAPLPGHRQELVISLILQGCHSAHMAAQLCRGLLQT